MGQCLKCCKMSNLVFLAEVQSFFEHAFYCRRRAEFSFQLDQVKYIEVWVSVNSGSQPDLIWYLKGFPLGRQNRPNTYENTAGQGPSSDTTKPSTLKCCC